MPTFTIDPNDETIVFVEGQVTSFDDRREVWSIWGLVSFIGLTGWQNKNSVMKDVSTLARGGMTVQKRQIVKINPQMYLYRQKKSLSLKISHTIEVGNTSFIWYNTVIDANTGSLLMEGAVKYVTISKSRKVIRVEDWFRKKYSDVRSQHLLRDEISRYSEVPQIPENSYKWQATIRYSDQDVNLHTSQSVYIKLCIDGATSAALNGKLKHFTEDMCFYPVDYLDITYIAESFPEDQLVINLWQDEREPSVLYFLITMNSKNMIYAIIKFGLTKLVTVQHSRL